MMKPKIILLSGFFGGAPLIKLSPQIRTYFWLKGFEFKIASMPLGDSVEHRVTRLENQIESLMGNSQDVHLVAHSEGGLVGRLFLNRNDPPTVKTLTTISTPHRGSTLADRASEGKLDKDELSNVLLGLKDLRTDTCAEFNKTVLDNPRVDYRSLGFYLPHPVFMKAPLYYKTWSTLYKFEGENDSMVSLTSAKWGQYLGSFEGPHLCQVNPIRWQGRMLWKDTFNTVLNDL